MRTTFSQNLESIKKAKQLDSKNNKLPHLQQSSKGSKTLIQGPSSRIATMTNISSPQKNKMTVQQKVTKIGEKQPIVNELQNFLSQQQFYKQEVDLDNLFKIETKQEQKKRQLRKKQEKRNEMRQIDQGLQQMQNKLNSVKNYVGSLPDPKFQETQSSDMYKTKKSQPVYYEEDQFENSKQTRQHAIIENLNKKLKLQHKSREVRFNDALNLFKDMDTFIDIKPFLQDMNLVNNEHQYKLMNKLKEKIEKKKQKDLLNQMLYPSHQKNEEKEYLGIDDHEFVPKHHLVKNASKMVMKFRRDKQDRFYLLTNQQVDYLKETMLNNQVEIGDPISDNGMFYEQLRGWLFDPYQQKQQIEREEEDEELMDLLMDKYLDNDIDENDQQLFKDMQERANEKFSIKDNFQNNSKKYDLSSEQYFQQYREKCEKAQKTLQKISLMQFKYKWGNAQMKIQKKKEDEKKKILKIINHPDRQEFNKFLFPSKETQSMSHMQKLNPQTKIYTSYKKEQYKPQINSKQYVNTDIDNSIEKSLQSIDQMVQQNYNKQHNLEKSKNTASSQNNTQYLEQWDAEPIKVRDVIDPNELEEDLKIYENIQKEKQRQSIQLFYSPRKENKSDDGSDNDKNNSDYHDIQLENSKEKYNNQSKKYSVNIQSTKNKHNYEKPSARYRQSTPNVGEYISNFFYHDISKKMDKVKKTEKDFLQEVKYSEETGINQFNYQYLKQAQQNKIDESSKILLKTEEAEHESSSSSGSNNNSRPSSKQKQDQIKIQDDQNSNKIQDLNKTPNYKQSQQLKLPDQQQKQNNNINNIINLERKPKKSKIEQDLEIFLKQQKEKKIQEEQLKEQLELQEQQKLQNSNQYSFIKQHQDSHYQSSHRNIKLDNSLSHIPHQKLSHFAQNQQQQQEEQKVKLLSEKKRNAMNKLKGLSQFQSIEPTDLVSKKKFLKRKQKIKLDANIQIEKRKFDKFIQKYEEEGQQEIETTKKLIAKSIEFQQNQEINKYQLPQVDSIRNLSSTKNY